LIIVDVLASTGALVGPVCLIAVRHSVFGRTGCRRSGKVLPTLPDLRRPVCPETERRTAIRQTLPMKAPVEAETSAIINKRLFFKNFILNYDKVVADKSGRFLMPTAECWSLLLLFVSYWCQPHCFQIMWLCWIIATEDVRKKFISHDRTIGLHDVRLSEIDLRLQCTETANYEGVLIWKIGEYRQRKLQAVGGRILSLYSQPFYTSRYGYKMCARIYLNGDGVGRGTHLSLFFVIMQVAADFYCCLFFVDINSVCSFWFCTEQFDVVAVSQMSWKEMHRSVWQFALDERKWKKLRFFYCVLLCFIVILIAHYVLF